jgi:predicted Na+-dependent transporter
MAGTQLRRSGLASHLRPVPMNLIVISFGVVLIMAILWEVFSDLFHPAGHGALSDWLARSLFHILRRTPRLLPIAGPLSLVMVIATWVAGLVPTDSSRILSALYFSFETLVTLGYGDQPA